MRTCSLNYETLVNIYHARKNHKLEEWPTLRDWIKTLPYVNDLILLKKTSKYKIIKISYKEKTLEKEPKSYGVSFPMFSFYSYIYGFAIKYID